MAQALVIIDVQQGMFSLPEMQSFDGDAVVARIRTLLEAARQGGVPVIFIQHDGQEGHPLDRNGPGFAYHEQLTPRPGEPIVVKRHCNAFQETDLAAQLQTLGIDTVMVCGMQSQYCVDTFVRSAVEHGLTVRLISDAHTTFGTAVLTAEQVIAHHNDVLGGGFAALICAAEVDFRTATAAG